MDGLIFFLIFVFVIVPIFKNIFKAPQRNQKRSRKSAPPPQKNPWGEVQSELKNRLQDLQGGSGQTHQHPVSSASTYAKRARMDRKQAAETRAVARGRNAKAMTKVSNRSRNDWGARGDKGLTSSKAIFSMILVAIAVYVVVFGGAR